MYRSNVNLDRMQFNINTRDKNHRNFDEQQVKQRQQNGMFQSHFSQNVNVDRQQFNSYSRFNQDNNIPIKDGSFISSRRFDNHILPQQQSQQVFYHERIGLVNTSKAQIQQDRKREQDKKMQELNNTFQNFMHPTVDRIETFDPMSRESAKIKKSFKKQRGGFNPYT
jgi:hypothetical protein